MTALTLNITPEFVEALIKQSGPEARLLMQQHVVREVAEMMLSEYKQDLEDRVLRDEVLDEFCAPAKNYWDRDNVKILDSFKDAIQRQVKAGVNTLISDTFNEKIKEIDKTVTDYAKGLKEIADASIQKHIHDATESYIQEQVATRLRRVAAQIAE